VFFLGKEIEFPPVDQADDFGLLAIGGDLSPDRLIKAYESGIFPWYSEGEPIVWYSPNPRMVLFPEELKVSKTMRQFLRKTNLKVSRNKAFEQVIEQCKSIARKEQEGTWITDEMQAAYIELNNLGRAVSFEVWDNEELVGGLYGVEIRKVFCGESMFSKQDNASKLAFIKMVEFYQRRNFELIDCQVYNDHLASLGAREVSRIDFLKFLDT
jgi:leucyl/phenylalanyl-tRNA--protein transferase